MPGLVYRKYLSTNLADPKANPLSQAAWDLAVLGYYNIAVHGLPFIYNWVAIIVTESLTMAFWAATFISLAALHAFDKYQGRVNGKIIIAMLALSAFALLVT